MREKGAKREKLRSLAGAKLKGGEQVHSPPLFQVQCPSFFTPATVVSPHHNRERGRIPLSLPYE